jgi:aminoglycoside phosphotransferase (APT) family kinase protein
MEKDLELIKFVANKNKLSVFKPARFSSGVINRVYDLGSYVIKIEGSDLTDYAKGVIKPQAEIMQKLSSLGAKVPKVLDHGEYEGHPYILMDKAEGKNLVYDWLKFSMKEKETFIAQLCEQLKIFHSVKFDHYALPIYQGKKFTNLKDAVANVTKFDVVDINALKKEYADDMEFLEDFFNKNISVLDEQNTAVLTHNDIHLENIFYKDNQITTIIDYDWTAQAPKDHELAKIVDVFYDPKRYMEKELEQLYKNYKMTEELKLLKIYYPQLFENPNILARVRIFNIEDMIYKVADYQNGKWSEDVMKWLHQQITDFFRSNWLSDLLS